MQHQFTKELRAFNERMYWLETNALESLPKGTSLKDAANLQADMEQKARMALVRFVVEYAS